MMTMDVTKASVDAAKVGSGLVGSGPSTGPGGGVGGGPGNSGGPQDCAGCCKPITDRFLLKALDLYWHEDCLKCGCCDCRLGEVGSTLYTKANLILCKRDYLRLFGNIGYCAACSKIIPAFEMVMRARSNVYHLECFACQQCNHRFCVGDRFYLCENKILCEYDYEERLVFANMAYNPPPLSHLKRQTAIPPPTLSGAQHHMMNGHHRGGSTGPGGGGGGGPMGNGPLGPNPGVPQQQQQQQQPPGDMNNNMGGMGGPMTPNAGVPPPGSQSPYGSQQMGGHGGPPGSHHLKANGGNPNANSPMQQMQGAAS